MFYGQRKEDQKIRELLGTTDPGFYIDVGAWDPKIDSVTKHFYDRGWSGINVEPVPEYFNKLCAARWRDINLQVALGAKAGYQKLITFEGSGLSTLDLHHLGETHDRFPRSEIFVDVLTLSAICRLYVPPTQKIDFIKIDVEGWEHEVLIGMNWEYAPRLLCIESTVPCTDTPSWESWEPLVLARGYRLREFDGLNRFYMREQE